jgi:hypothetical protein
MQRLVVAVVLLATACAGSGPPHAFDALVGSPGVVTLVNLHPDEGRSRLFAVNYQQDGLIPLCTPVVLLDRNRERLVFEVAETGRRYEYYHHKAAAEPLADHLMRYFGTTCPAERATLTGIDREGVAQGKALVGMRKQAVVLAIGYPPPHVTPSLDANRWFYWKNRFNRMAVIFVDGRVTALQD